MVVIGLVEEDVLAVLDPLHVGGVLFEDAGGTDAVLLAELLPELGPNCVEGRVLWLPHCPIWIVMISRGINSNLILHFKIINI